MAAFNLDVLNGDPVGPLATINREPGQAWKGAAVAVTLCAGVWLAGSPPLKPRLYPALAAFPAEPGV